MPSLSPFENRRNYTLYDNKIVDVHESAQAVDHLGQRVAAIGYRLVIARGDAKKALPL